MNAFDREKTSLPLLGELPMFAHLDPDVRRFLAGGSYQRTELRGRVLCEKGGLLDGFFCVLSGRVKLAVLAEDGAERVVEIVQPGASFGEASAFLGKPFPLHAEALSDTGLLVVGAGRLREAVGRWPEVALVMTDALARRVYTLIQDIESCCLMPAPRRVAEFLLREIDGRGARPDGQDVVLPAAKAVVASTLNLTAETFSRELHGLARDGLVKVDRRTIRVLSLEGLRRRCSGSPN
jgi:CRP-like cAMP-binding protein